MHQVVAGGGIFLLMGSRLATGLNVNVLIRRVRFGAAHESAGRAERFRWDSCLVSVPISVRCKMGARVADGAR